MNDGTKKSFVSYEDMSRDGWELWLPIDADGKKGPVNKDDINPAVTAGALIRIANALETIAKYVRQKESEEWAASYKGSVLEQRARELGSRRNAARAYRKAKKRLAEKEGGILQVRSDHADYQGVGRPAGDDDGGVGPGGQADAGEPGN